MCKRIRSGCIVSIDSSFIEKFGRTDLSPGDTWKVVNVISICGDKKVAYLVNTKTLTKIDLFTCNLILI